MSTPHTFVYVTYINSTPERVWDALTDPEQTAVYWGHGNVSDWRVGSAWAHRRTDGSGIDDVVGTVLASERPSLLATSWLAPDHAPDDAPSVATFELRGSNGVVRLALTHADLGSEAERDEVAGGWFAVLANLKTYLESGSPLAEAPWDLA